MKNMKRHLAVAALLVLSACCNPPPLANVSVPVRGQQQSNWCWAASGQMTMNFVRPAANVSQPDEANKRLGRTDCANSPTPAACNKTGWPEYEKYNFSATRTTNAPITFDQIKSQIGCAKKPFAFSWHWNGGGGHMMVVVGYATINNVNYVSIIDPLPVNTGTAKIIPYDEYVGGPSYDHTHWDDFYNITSTGG